LYSGAIFIQEAVQWSIYGAIALLLGLTAVGTALGGLTAVIYTDTLQFVIMIAGSLYVMIKGNSYYHVKGKLRMGSLVLIAEIKTIRIVNHRKVVRQYGGRILLYSSSNLPYCRK